MVLIIKKLLTKYEVSRFLIVGMFTVLVDLFFYSIMFYFGFSTSLSKGVSFSTGTIFSYFANRKYTFRSSVRKVSKLLIFCLIYLSTLIINVVTNETVLELTGRTEISFLFAFILATLLSATLNFIGMRRYVFCEEK
jgi:putative flippase GtrA